MAKRLTSFGVVVLIGLFLVGAFGVAAAWWRLRGDDADETGPRIGVVEIKGVISESRDALSTLRHFRKDEEIEAIVVRIDSPGGSVGPSQEIYREIERTRKTKPVVASMGSVAASGGYYIAAACEKIVASPGTITGSIGVITQTTQISELLDLAKIRSETFKSGAFKDTGNPTRPLTDPDRKLMQKLIDGIYRQFVRDVAKGRKLKVAQVKPVADGRVLTGAEAKRAGLVDKLGNFTDSLEVAAKLAKATEGEPVPVYLRKKKSLIRELLDDMISQSAQSIREQLTSRRTIEVREPSLRP